MISKCLLCLKTQFKLNYILLHKFLTPPTIPACISPNKKSVTLEITVNKTRDTIKISSVENTQAYWNMA